MAKKILIIEDDAMMVRIVVDHLQEKGYETEAAFDGEEGLEKVQSFQPDLILLDLILPKLDGISVLKKLKQDASTAHIPVFVLTNIQTQERIAQAMEAGAALHIIKVNYTLEEISAKITEELR